MSETTTNIMHIPGLIALVALNLHPSLSPPTLPCNPQGPAPSQTGVGCCDLLWPMDVSEHEAET